MSRVVCFWLLCLCVWLAPCVTASAQIDMGMDINAMLKEAQAKEKARKDKKKDKKEKKGKKKAGHDMQGIELPDISGISIGGGDGMSIGDALDMAWGNPVAVPTIRRNCASNLFGLVRHNADGTKRWHGGFDYYAPVGTDVYAVGQGVVVAVGEYSDYGNYVMIEHVRSTATYYSMYAHLSAMFAREGDTVKRGTVIGKSGNTGNAYNMAGDDEHLHFECRTQKEFGGRCQLNPNTIVATHFYSADPDAEYQSNVGVVTR